MAAEDAMLPRGLLPDDLFPLVMRYLVGDVVHGLVPSGTESESGSESE